MEISEIEISTFSQGTENATEFALASKIFSRFFWRNLKNNERTERSDNLEFRNF